jgi:hypothetical protein
VLRLRYALCSELTHFTLQTYACKVMRVLSVLRVLIYVLVYARFSSEQRFTLFTLCGPRKGAPVTDVTQEPRPPGRRQPQCAPSARRRSRGSWATGEGHRRSHRLPAPIRVPYPPQVALAGQAARRRRAATTAPRYHAAAGDGRRRPADGATPPARPPCACGDGGRGTACAIRTPSVTWLACRRRR